ncbi:MAG: NAD(P)/FAD-dependent oxidoreductase [Deltaproteobacteria bacterium]
MKKYDVLIIGAGVIGTSIARELSRYRLRVAVLEKEVELSFGVSKSNSGIIHPGTQNPVGSLKGRLCVEGNRLTRIIAAELGADFKEPGSIIVAFSTEQMTELEKIRADGEKLGVPGLRIVDRPWLHEHEPNLSPGVIAALYAPTTGIISPYRWVYDLSENARRNGVEIHTSARVTAIEKRGDGLFDVTSAAGPFRARYVINAAGLFADAVSAMAGISGFKITPRKGEEFLLDKKRENLTNHLVFPLPTKTSKGVIVIKTSDGNPMIGPTAEDVPDKCDLSTTEEGMKKVFSLAKMMVPSVNERDIIAYFSGLRPVAGADFIIRNETLVPGFVNVAGMQSPGLTAAPAIAVYVRGLLQDAGLGLRKKLFFHKYRKKDIHLFSIPLSLTRKLIGRHREYGDIVCRCEMVSAREIEEAIARGAKTMDGIKFRTRAQAGRCHGSFCTTRIMKILAKKTGIPVTAVTKRGPGTEIVKKEL